MDTIAALILGIGIGIAIGSHASVFRPKEVAYYRINNGSLEKSTGVYPGNGGVRWEPVRGLVPMNCSGSWPDPGWTKEDYAKKAQQIEECRKKFGTETEGKLWE